MTTTPLMNNKIDTYQNSILNVQENKENSASGFDSILKQQEGNLYESKETDVNQKLEKVDTKSKYENTASESEKVENNSSDKSDIKDFEEIDCDKTSIDMIEEEEMIAYAESMVGNLLSDIANVLNVSVEEVDQILETLGIEVTELVDVTNLTQFLLEFNGSNDLLELTTNQDLYSVLQELTNLMEEVTKEVEQNDYSMDDITELLKESEVEIVSKEPEVDGEVTVIDGDEMKDVNGYNDGESIAVEENVEVTITKHSEAGSDQGYSNEQTSQFEFLNQNQQNVNNTVSSSQESTTFTTSQSNQIMNQIFDQMTSSLKSQVTEIELQLNPESLGKVNVHLLSQEGTISAKFIAENEMVKTLLENQMVQLKENFAQQGLKVSAVEVAVEYQGFQENKQPQEDRAEQEKKNRSRALSVEELLEEEIYTEEEQLAVQMMNDNGNSVDYVV